MTSGFENRPIAAKPAIGARDKTKAPSRLALFLRSAVPDFLLVLIASTALVYTVSYAFESAPDLRERVLVCAGLCVPMLVILFAGSWSKRAIAFSALGAVVYAACVIAWFGMQTPPGVEMFVDGQVNDVPENQVVFAFVALVVPVVCYLLSRRRALVVLLLVAGVVACGWVQFVYRDWTSANPGTLAAFIVIVSVGALYIFQSYRSTIREVRQASRTSFGGACGFSLLISLVCLMLGCAVFYALISPLGLMTPDIRPFQDFFMRPVIEYSGVYENQQVDNPDEFTDDLNDEQKETNQDAEGGQDQQSADEEQDWSGNPLSPLLRNLTSFLQNTWTEMFTALSYEQIALRFVLLALVVIALCAAIVAAQKLRRKRRLERFAKEGRAKRVWLIYRFITERFSRLGFRKPPTYTQLEFAFSMRTDMVPFTRGTGGVDYLALTLAYQRACYAPETVTDEDVDAMERFYRAFFDNARRLVGRRRWLYYFWKI